MNPEEKPNTANANRSFERPAFDSIKIEVDLGPSALGVPSYERARTQESARNASLPNAETKTPPIAGVPVVEGVPSAAPATQTPVLVGSQSRTQKWSPEMIGLAMAEASKSVPKSEVPSEPKTMLPSRTVKMDVSQLVAARQDPPIAMQGNARPSHTLAHDEGGFVKREASPLAQAAARKSAIPTADVATNAAGRVPSVAPVVSSWRPPVSIRWEKWKKQCVRWLPAIGGALALVAASTLVLVRSFYDLNHRWMVPAKISATDPRVLQMKSYMAQESTRRAELANYKREIEARLRQTQRLASEEKAFQEAFRKTLQADLQHKRSELAELQSRAATQEALRAQIYKAASAQIGDAQANPPQTPGAPRLGSLEAAQDTQSHISILRNRIRLLSEVAQADALAPSNYRSLGLAAQLERSHVALEYATSLSAALENSIASANSLLASYDANIATAAQSPYLAATERGMFLAFVPYQNLGEMSVGAPLFGCLGVASCTPVGKIEAILTGEVTASHPRRSEELRGVFVKVSFNDPSTAAESTVFVKKGVLL